MKIWTAVLKWVIRIVSILILFLALIVLAYQLFPTTGPRFIVTASIPVGLYWAEPVQVQTLQRGDTVCFSYRTPGWASGRHYFDEGSLLCKFVQALPGDRVIRVGDELILHDGQAHIQVLSRFSTWDSRGRMLPAALEPHESLDLQSGSFWLGSTALRGLDSRYLGQISAGDIRLKITPVLLLHDYIG